VGAAIAKRLAADGAKVVVNYARAEKRAAEVADAIRAAGGTAIPVHADVSDDAQVRQMFERTMRELGRLDILVNNAAILEEGPITELDRAAFQRLIDVNLWGVIGAAREAVRHFGEAGGRIINIGSCSARMGMANYVAYAATKGGIEAATRCLAAELAPRKILVNAVAAGGVNTDMTASAPEEGKRAFARMTPLGRMGEPDDFGGVVSFLASDDAAWITGQIIPVNGGFLM
jgi:3-oxoacyl-[acyl-carrier protein] reductase